MIMILCLNIWKQIICFSSYRYWIISPRERSVEVYYLEGTEYKLVGSHILVDDKEDENYNAEIMLTLRSLPTISIILEKIFENIE